MRWGIGGVLAWVCAGAPASELSLSITADSLSEPVSIHDFAGHWQGSFEGGKHAYLQGRAELSFRDETRELALFRRYDNLLEFSPETAELYNAYAKHQWPLAGKVYALRLEARYVEARGVRWAPRLHLSDTLEISPGFSLLQGMRVTDGRIDGDLSFQSAGFSGKDVDAAGLTVDYRYDRPRLYENKLGWQPPAPQGEGVSLDLKADWSPDADTRVRMQILDLYGRMRWRDTPATDYRLAYLPGGTPDLTGQLAVDKVHVQTLPMRGSLSAVKRLGAPWSVGLEAEANRALWLGRLTGAYTRGGWTSTLLWEPATGALGVDVAHAVFHARWLADSLDINRAHRLGLSLAAIVHW